MSGPPLGRPPANISKSQKKQALFNPGSASELWVLAGAIALLIVGTYLASDGSITP